MMESIYLWIRRWTVHLLIHDVLRKTIMEEKIEEAKSSGKKRFQMVDDINGKIDLRRDEEEE